MKLKISQNWRTATLTGALLLGVWILPIAAQQQHQSKREKVTSAQEQLYVVSAKAGGINHVSGAAHVVRAATKQTQILANGDELGDNDNVLVGEKSRIEILLNPGSFVRLNENTNLEFTETALESLKLKLVTGSALFEATAIGGESGADVLISTPQAVIQLEKSGIYRINTNLNATEIYVWRGAARVGNEIIKSGRKAVVGKTGARAEIIKFDKGEARDSLDTWSKDRAKELAKANNRLKDRELARAFRDSSVFGFSSRPFGAGYWVFDRLSRGYCFVPYGFSYWDSPYGFGYGNGIFYDRRPIIIRQQSNPVFADHGSGGVRPDSGMPASPSMPSSTAPTMNSGGGRPIGRPIGHKVSPTD